MRCSNIQGNVVTPNPAECQNHQAMPTCTPSLIAMVTTCGLTQTPTHKRKRRPSGMCKINSSKGNHPSHDISITTCPMFASSGS